LDDHSITEAVDTFLLGFPALFSIVNPISGAFIFRGVTASRSARERGTIARKVALNSFVVMMGSLWAGAYILAFFGITVAALRVAGGVVVALSGWHMLNTPERREERKQGEAARAEGVEDVALFPLTIPFTTGPGTIAVAVALGAGHPKLLDGLGWFFLGMTAAALAMSAVIWIFYHYADRLAEMTGPNGSRTISRIAAFLLLCIGVQILIRGVQDVLGPMLAAR
jgi:multiple antibiotic resistance protein